MRLQPERLESCLKCGSALRALSCRSFGFIGHFASGFVPTFTGGGRARAYGKQLYNERQRAAKFIQTMTTRDETSGDFFGRAINAKAVAMRLAIFFRRGFAWNILQETADW